VGGGLEYKFAPAWSVKAEYQYINFGTINPTNAAGFAYASSAFNSQRFVNSEAFNTVRVGINYAFSGPVIAKY
jgi:outer membrane immunogenic protein